MGTGMHMGIAGQHQTISVLCPVMYIKKGYIYIAFI